MILIVGVLAGLMLFDPTPSTSTSPSSSPTPNDMHSLIVYGKGWTFIAHEPEGWTGYTERSGEIGANLYFLHSGETLSQNGSLIRVSIQPKVDSAIERDLAADMANFKRDNPDIQFIDFAAEYSGGTVFAKIYRRAQGDEYVAYVNTDPKAKYYFIVSYDPPMRQQATDADLNVYRAVIQSLTCCMAAHIQN